MKTKEKENRRKIREFRRQMKTYLIGGKVETALFWLLTAKVTGRV